jgi:hypothetical protein
MGYTHDFNSDSSHSQWQLLNLIPFITTGNLVFVLVLYLKFPEYSDECYCDCE